MKTDQKKAPPEAEINALEIKLERIPVENLAEVTATLDRVRTTAEKLVGKIAEATEKLENGEITYGQFESIAAHVGQGFTMLNQGMRIVLSAAAAKQKLDSGK
jgi:hypothetical protein